MVVQLYKQQTQQATVPFTFDFENKLEAWCSLLLLRLSTCVRTGGTYFWFESGSRKLRCCAVVVIKRDCAGGMHARTHRIPETASHLHMNSALAFTELGMHACMGACTFLKSEIYCVEQSHVDGYCAGAAYDKTCS